MTTLVLGCMPRRSNTIESQKKSPKKLGPWIRGVDPHFRHHRVEVAQVTIIFLLRSVHWWTFSSSKSRCPFCSTLDLIMRLASHQAHPRARRTASNSQTHTFTRKHTRFIMFFAKQALLFSSLLVGALVSAAPLPMPIANAVSWLPSLPFLCAHA
jgi:hypothetical protein